MKKICSFLKKIFNKVKNLFRKQRKIAQVYLYQYYRIYGNHTLKAVYDLLDTLYEVGFTGVYLIALWDDGGFDNGFDVISYRTNRKFTDAEGESDTLAVIEKAHSLGMIIGADVVPNHVSDKNVLAQRCLKGVKGYKDALYVVTPEMAAELKEKGVPSFFGSEPYSEVEGFEGKGKYVRNSFCDGKQLNVNWNNAKVRKYFKGVFSRFKKLYHFDFARIDCGMMLLEDVSKAKPGLAGMVSCMNPRKSVEAVRSVAGNMLLFYEWFGPSTPEFSPDIFNEDKNSFALDCSYVFNSKQSTSWDHPKLVPLIGGHDQQPFYNAADEQEFTPSKVLENMKKSPCKYVFSDIQSEMGYKIPDAELAFTDEDKNYDADPNNLNKRFLGRRPPYCVTGLIDTEPGDSVD